MSDEQRRVALFQAQPEGLGLFSPPAALSFAHVEELHYAHSALLGTKTAPAGRIGLVLTGPNIETNYLTTFQRHIRIRLTRIDNYFKLSKN
ncbi:MAG: hypothetical protein G8D66_06245 [gamma proteobacterium symbiont of Ctena orbiculata]|uniref:Uncharacterized protein n=1 Tax=Candidatus Thiodiazotropha taylori TaxID=2792791 RepID=A0A9E4TTR1_9GAMM|nr:hypothetical protein [Candidatus Thiodiazotropha taylori]MCW4236368.1 hypothetical protein [Candidatus Thiodiazotropha endolucinida]